MSERTGPSGRSHMRALVVGLAIVFALLLAASTLRPKPTEAYPTFAQALGVNCSMCHTMVPELNAYGRYLQRTWYAPLTQQALAKTFPGFIWYQAAGNNKGGLDSANANFKDVLTDVFYDYFVGFAGQNITYRVEADLVSADQPVLNYGPETMWAAYHALLHGDLHIQAGMDYPGPVPAFLANPSDYENFFQLRHFREGSHSYNLINRRLTFRADYEKGPIDVEVAWRGGTTNPIAAGPSDFSTLPGTDRAFPQWKVAYAPPNQPYEFGDFGILGTYVTNLKGAPTFIDHYWQNAPYFQLDPGFIGKMKWLPGVMAFDLWGHDSNPGVAVFPPYGPTFHDGAVELMEPIFKGAAVLTVRREWINYGGYVGTPPALATLGTEAFTSTGTSFQPFPRWLPWMFGRFGVLMNGYSSIANGKPTFQWALQFEPPLSGPWTNPFTRNRMPSPDDVAAYPGPPPTGASLYAENCQACHRPTGVGTPPTFPSLVGDAMVTSSDATALITIVKKGSGTMPGYEMRLSNAQIAQILTYIRSSWGNSAGPVSETDAAQ